MSYWTKVLLDGLYRGYAIIKNHVSIDERPEIVDQKTRIGDWEGDTVIGKNHKGGCVTLDERKSRYVLVGHTQQACQCYTRLFIRLDQA
jgi:IS30 family transposase